MKYKFRIEDLDCPNCAAKVEKYLNNDSNLSNVSINFSKLTLTLETDLKKDVKKYVEKLSQDIEPDMKLFELTDNISLDKKRVIFDILKLVIGILLAIIGIKIEINIIILIAYGILLYEIIIKAIKLFIKTHTIDENLLITISCIGAYLLGEIHEGIMVVVLYNIGKILEKIAVNNSRKSIADLMDIKPEYANLKVDSKVTKVNPESVKIDDIIIIKKGEKIPLDGIIIKGETKLNKVALTGETKLSIVKENDEVLSGSINEGNIIEIKVTKDYENSTVSKILELVENASDRKAAPENFVAKAAKIYTPLVIVGAITTGVILKLLNYSNEIAIYRALSFLVVSCPCAIAISVPLSYFSGIGLSSKKGILIKGSDYLDSLRKINKIIFDKTGTITTGNLNNFNLTILNNDYKEKEIIDYYVKGETYSNHPIGKSIINYFNKKVSTKDVNNFKEKTGKGIEYDIENKHIIIGSNSFVNSNSQDNSIYLKIDKDIIAKLDFIDTIKDNAKESLSKLNKLGIKTLMFTGDEEKAALKIAEKVNIDEVKYNLLPEDKYNLLKEEIINNPKYKTAFVGDGINDAPSIRLADIGISMGNVGSSSAIEASDVVIANDDLNKISEAIKISKYTHKIVVQNLVFSLGIKLLVLILCTLGIAGMSLAVFADTGVTLLAILNTTRIFKIK